MHQKTILGAIAVVVLLVCGFAVWKLSASKPGQTPAEQTIFTASKAALAQLQTDLQAVTPHFIDRSDSGAQSLTPEEQKIKDDLVAVFIAQNPGNDKDYYSNAWLNAVGKRYILASQPSGGSSLNEIIDSQTGKITLIPEGGYSLALEGRDAILYIDTQAIRTYTLDQADAVLVAGSQLSGNETYHSGTSDFTLVPVQTYTKNSITISVFDSSQLVQNPDAKSQPTAMQTMNKKVRTVTLSF
jgi:hypothetical protein